jgi:hypothetical protein
MQQGKEKQNTEVQHKMAYSLISRKANKTYHKIIYNIKMSFHFRPAIQLDSNNSNKQDNKSSPYHHASSGIEY